MDSQPPVIEADAPEVALPMSSSDLFAELLGMHAVKSEDGDYVVQMEVGHEHTNGMGVAHGGAVFSLVDAAAALAAFARPGAYLSINSSINFHRTANLGDVLTARARGRHTGRRLSSIAVDVTCDDRLIATASVQLLAHDIPAAQRAIE